MKLSIPITVLLFGSALLSGSAQATRPLDLEYREAAGRLIGAAMVDRGGYDRLAYLTTRIGNRLSGSSGLENDPAFLLPANSATPAGNAVPHERATAAHP